MTLNLGRDSGLRSPLQGQLVTLFRRLGGLGGLVQLAGRIETLTDHALAESIELNIELKSKTEKLLTLWDHFYCKTTPTANGPIKRTQRRKCLQKVSYIAVKHIIYIGTYDISSILGQYYRHIWYIWLWWIMWGWHMCSLQKTFNNDFWPVYTSLLCGLPLGCGGRMALTIAAKTGFNADIS